MTDICSNVHEDGSNSVRKIGEKVDNGHKGLWDPPPPSRHLEFWNFEVSISDLIPRGLSETRFGYILCRIAKKRSDSQVLLFCVASHQANTQMVHLLGVEAVVAPKIT